MPELKAYKFLWTNPETGITDKEGTIFYWPHVKVVIAFSEVEARRIFEEREKHGEEIMREQQPPNRPVEEINELVRKVFTKTDFSIQEFELKDGLIV